MKTLLSIMICFFSLTTIAQIDSNWIILPSNHKPDKIILDTIYGTLVYVDQYNDELITRLLYSIVNEVVSYYGEVSCNCGDCSALCYGWKSYIKSTKYFHYWFEPIEEKRVIKFIPN